MHYPCTDPLHHCVASNYSQQLVYFVEKIFSALMTMCISCEGGRGKGSQCTIHTNKSVDTGEQIFDTLL